MTDTAETIAALIAKHRNCCCGEFVYAFQAVSGAAQINRDALTAKQREYVDLFQRVADAAEAT